MLNINNKKGDVSWLVNLPPQKLGFNKALLRNQWYKLVGFLEVFRVWMIAGHERLRLALGLPDLSTETDLGLFGTSPWHVTCHAKGGMEGSKIVISKKESPFSSGFIFRSHVGFGWSTHHFSVLLKPVWSRLKAFIIISCGRSNAPQN